MPEDQITDDQAESLLADAVNESDTDDTVDWKAEAEKYKALHRKQEARAKENATARTELERLRKAAMTEQEKAVAEAEARGKAAATSAAAARLARAEFRAAAAGRVDQDALDGFLEYVDPSKFLSDDGEPDTKAIDAVIKKLAGPKRSPNFDGGARTSPGRASDMNELIRKHAGIR